MIQPFYLKVRNVILVCLLLATYNANSQSLDAKLLNKMNPNGTGVNPVWNDVSNSVAPLAIATPIVMMGAGLISHDDNLKKNAILTGVAFLSNKLMTSSIKNSLQRTRPFNAYPDMITLQGTASGYSFPSGHTSAAFNMATSLTLSFKKWYVAVPAYGYAAATGYSRMYRGAHYPTDVFAGMLVGAGSSYLTWKLQKMMFRRGRSSVNQPN